MPIEAFKLLPPALRRGLLEGYLLPEMENYRFRDELHRRGFSIEVGSKTIAELTEKDAYLHGVGLRAAILFVFSADHYSDLVKDVQSYNIYADQLNTIYGQIAVTLPPERAIHAGLGIVGYLVAPFHIIETEIYQKGTTTYAVEFPQTELDFKNEKERKKL